MVIFQTNFYSIFNIGLELTLKYVYRIYCAGKRIILSLSTYGKTILFMMYISENNTLKLRVCDGTTVHIRDEYII